MEPWIYQFTSRDEGCSHVIMKVYLDLSGYHIGNFVLPRFSSGICSTFLIHLNKLTNIPYLNTLSEKSVDTPLPSTTSSTPIFYTCALCLQPPWTYQGLRCRPSPTPCKYTNLNQINKNTFNYK